MQVFVTEVLKSSAAILPLPPSDACLGAHDGKLEMSDQKYKVEPKAEQPV
jgi:hypothetical protein